MTEDRRKDGVKVLRVFTDLLFLSKEPGDGNSQPDGQEAPDIARDIKSRVLLKIERAEIMAAMMAMREGKEDAEPTKIDPFGKK